MSHGTDHSGSSPLPVDLIAIGSLGLATIVVSLEGIELSFPLIALGMVAILFAPGYALITALFPNEGSGSAFGGSGRTTLYGSDSDPRRGTVTMPERLLLSVGLGVGLVPLLGIGLEFAIGEVDPSLFVRVVGGMTLILTVVAAFRRFMLSPEDRFNPAIGGTVVNLLGTGGRDWDGSVLTLLIIVGLVVAGSGIGFAVATADREEQFTEFYLVTEDEATGDTVASGYPTEIQQGETASLEVGITNQEGERMDYTVVVLLQSFDEDGEIQVVQRLGSFEVTVRPGETVERSHTIRPGLSGQGLRLTYLLYVGDPPENAGLETDSAYRHVHIWIDVSQSAN